jgi:HSP20 family protein
MASTNMQPQQQQQRPAEVVRWDPFEDLEHLQQQLAQVFSGLPRMPGMGRDPEFAPVADVEETDDAYIVEMELAGVKKDGINIELSGRRLSVSGERKEKERQGRVRRRTRTVGRFRYEIAFPVDVDDKKIEANLNEGVLTVRIPKAAAERPKQITIK